MRMFLSLMILLQCLFAGNASASAFSGNKIDDLFEIKSITGKTALASGKTAGIKEGDWLYFSRSPFRFQVSSVKGNQITVNLPDGHDLQVGQNLLRNETDAIKKAINKEKRLKQALEE